MTDRDYPLPIDAETSTRMRANRRRDTRPERRIRSLLHGRGLRFRVDFRVVADDVTVRPDIVFTRARVAIFIDGCFWHVCPIHGNQPQRNRGYWEPKLLRNVERDKRVTAALKRAGWQVIRAWEHEDPRDIADEIERLVRHLTTTASIPMANAQRSA